MAFPLKPRVPKINWLSPLTKGLVFHMPLFEGGGTTTKDIVSVTSANLSGDASWKIEQFGKTVGFAGSTGAISFPNNQAVFDALTIGAVVFFFKTSQADNNIFIHGRHNSSQSNGGFTLYLGAGTGFINAQIKTAGASTVCQLTGTRNLRDGSLHMGILNFNQANGAAENLYIDGRLEASSTNSASWSWNAVTLQWGTGSDGFWTKLNGNIGPSSWYKRQLSAAEVKQLYINPWQIYTSQRKDLI